MNDIELNEIIERQKSFFKSSKTNDLKFRKEILTKLKKALKKYEDDIKEAVYKDLGKSYEETYMCEIGMVFGELSYILKNLKKLAKPRKAKTPLFQFRAKSYTVACPYGNTLIMSPWNYPVLLSLDPLVEAIAAGNTVILKPSKYSKYTSDILKKICDETFERGHVDVILGGREENQALLEKEFDYIFFTGSKNVGKLVYEKAAKYLTPVTLELGGKSPCIVTKSANIKLAARRIVWGKFINCGQTCVAPDYIFVERSIQDKLIDAIIKEIKKQYTDNPLENQYYGKIINETHYNRLIGLISKEKVIYGGNYSNQRIEPTIMNNVSFDDPVMQEEIFGPLMPIIPFDNINECKNYIESNDAPLALYIFTSNKKEAKYVTRQIGFGGGCINDTVMHIATDHIPFGGFKASGLGNYHGKYGFDTFSHTKSILDKKTWIDMPMRYKPRKKMYNKMIRTFLK